MKKLLITALTALLPSVALAQVPGIHFYQNDFSAPDSEIILTHEDQSVVRYENGYIHAKKMRSEEMVKKRIQNGDLGNLEPFAVNPSVQNRVMAPQSGFIYPYEISGNFIIDANYSYVNGRVWTGTGFSIRFTGGEDLWLTCIAIGWGSDILNSCVVRKADGTVRSVGGNGIGRSSVASGDPRGGSYKFRFERNSNGEMFVNGTKIQTNVGAAFTPYINNNNFVPMFGTFQQYCEGGNCSKFGESNGEGWSRFHYLQVQSASATPFDVNLPGDSDQDGISNSRDNCILVPNFDQQDLNQDGIWDFCFNTDIDNDGVPNEQDNCPNNANPNQADDDFDMVGNVCDACPCSHTWDKIDYDCFNDEYFCDDYNDNGAPGHCDECDWEQCYEDWDTASYPYQVDYAVCGNRFQYTEAPSRNDCTSNPDGYLCNP